MGRFGWLEFSGSQEKSAPQMPAPAAPSADILSLELLNKADDFFFAGLYGKALREYSRAIDEDKTNRLAWVRQTVCQIALKEYEQAVVWAQKFVEIFPEDPQALSSLALAKSRIPFYLNELPNLLEQIARKSGGSYSPQMQFEKAVCLFALQQNDDGQKIISAMLESLDSRLEQVRWMILCSALYLDMRAPDCACVLLETLDNDRSLTPYGLSLWIKAEWLRNDPLKAKQLLKRLRKCDHAAPETYEIQKYFDNNPLQQGHAMLNFFGQILDKFHL